MSDKIEKTRGFIEKSPFNISPNYQVDTHLRRLQSNLSAYNTEAEDNATSLSETLKIMTPLFQRDNDKWSREKQVSFTQNIIAGLRTTITLFYISSDDNKLDTLSDCFILDGLQRLTALSGFIEGRFDILGDVDYRSINDPGILANARISLRIYRFDSVQDAVDFYIAMNEGITHSEDDIERARRFLKSN